MSDNDPNLVMEFLEGLNATRWMVLGILLLGLELATGTSYILWVASAAIITAAMVFILEKFGHIYELAFLASAFLALDFLTLDFLAKALPCLTQSSRLIRPVASESIFDSTIFTSAAFHAPIWAK